MVSLRDAREEDEPALRRLDVAAWSPRWAPAPPPDPEQPLVARFGTENVIVAAADDDPVGFLILTPWSKLESSRHVLLLNGLVVDPARQGEGIGGRLLEAGIKRARERGARRLVLRVLSTNDAARRLYERHGFRLEGTRHEAFLLEGAYVDDLLLALDLTA